MPAIYGAAPGSSCRDLTTLRTAARGAGTAGSAPRAGPRAARTAAPARGSGRRRGSTRVVATSRAKLISCVASTIVVPASARSRTMVSTSPTSSGSRAAVISSSSSSSGSVHSARTSATRCCWPPESRSGCLSTCSDRPKRARSSRAALDGVGPPYAVHPDRRQHAVVEHRQVREQVVGLEDHPDPAAHGARVDARVGDLDAVEADHAVVDLLQQVEAAQQGGLARARRPDQADHVVALHGQVDVGEHHPVAVRLADVGELDERRHSAPARSRSSQRRCSQSHSRASGTVQTTKKPATTTSGV